MEVEAVIHALRWIALRGDVQEVNVVAALFVSTALFVAKVTKCAAMPTRFVTSVIMTNRPGTVPFPPSTCDIVFVMCVCACERACVRVCVCV